MAPGRNCFVGDVQTNRGAIRRANLFSNRIWGWTGGRCSSGVCAVLCKGRVTFSCVLKVLPEREADFVGAGEPRDSPAPACYWGETEIIALCQTSGWISPPLPGCRISQRGDEDVSSVARVDLRWKPGRERRRLASSAGGEDGPVASETCGAGRDWCLGTADVPVSCWEQHVGAVEVPGAAG